MFSDTMGNKGAFITMNGKDMKPNFITYSAVVSIFHDNLENINYLRDRQMCKPVV